MLYRLPTKSIRTYRGKYPNAINSISSGGGKDIDGKTCIHFETNCGERFTASLSVIDMEAFNAAKSFVGMNFAAILKNNTVVNTMTQAQYDVWLAGIRAERAAKA